METKQCRRCGEVKPVREFSKCTGTKDGLQAMCKVCYGNYHAQYHAANREARLAYSAARYAANREAMQADADLYVKHMLQRAKTRAKKKHIPFNLRPADIILPARCPVLGIPMYYDPGLGLHEGSPSLDRLIPSLGYVPGNVRVISFRANQIKSDGTLEELEAIAKWLRKETSREAC